MRNPINLNTSIDLLPTIQNLLPANAPTNTTKPARVRNFADMRLIYLNNFWLKTKKFEALNNKLILNRTMPCFACD